MSDKKQIGSSFFKVNMYTYACNISKYKIYVEGKIENREANGISYGEEERIYNGIN